MKRRFSVKFKIAWEVMVDIDHDDFPDTNDLEDIARNVAAMAIDDCQAKWWTWTKVDPECVVETDETYDGSCLHVVATNPYDDEDEPDFEYIKEYC